MQTWHGRRHSGNATAPSLRNWASYLFSETLPTSWSVQDGKLTTEELLTGLALDSVVGDGGIDADAVKVGRVLQRGALAQASAIAPASAVSQQSTHRPAKHAATWLHTSGAGCML